MGTDPVTGKRLRKTVYGKTKTEVLKKLRAVQAEGPSAFRSSLEMTIADLLTEWLASTKPTLAPKSYDRNEGVARNHVIPKLGAVKLVDLKPADVSRMLAKLEQEGKKYRTLQLARSTLGAAIEQAFKAGVVGENVVRKVAKPRSEHKEMAELDASQVQSLVRACEGERLGPLFVFLADSGCRLGEALALTWKDVDLEKGTVRVTKSLSDSKTGLEVKQTKTKAGRRTIHLAATTVEWLQAHKRRSESEDHGSDIVFCSRNGTHLRQSNVSRVQWKRIRKQAGLPEIGLHGLRHTSASLLLSLGIPIVTVSRRLGHESVRITLDIYGHCMPEDQARAGTMMDSLISNGSQLAVKEAFGASKDGQED